MKKSSLIKKMSPSNIKKPKSLFSNTSKIAGIETGTLLSVGAAVLGAAAVSVAGYMLWKKRDKISGFVENIGEEISERFGKGHPDHDLDKDRDYHVSNKTEKENFQYT